MKNNAIQKDNSKLDQRIANKIIEREKEIENEPDSWIDFDTFINDLKKDL